MSEALFHERVDNFFFDVEAFLAEADSDIAFVLYIDMYTFI